MHPVIFKFKRQIRKLTFFLDDGAYLYEVKHSTIEFLKLDFLQKSKNDQRFVCFLSTLKSHVLLS